MNAAEIVALVLIALALSAANVWSLRDLIIYYYKDRYNINIDKDNENDSETVDTAC